jgi:uncharacterized protein (UPF0254 family)
MPTDNPKVSAYVPQAVYNHIKAFQEERSLSMSQAATIIFAEYFGIEETIGKTAGGTTVGGVTLGALQALEEKMDNLAQSKSEPNSKLLNQFTEEWESRFASLSGSLENGLQSLEERIKKLEENADSSLTTKQSTSELPSKVQMVATEKLEPHSTSELAGRLGVNTTTLTRHKNGKLKPSLVEWTRKKDPQGVAWDYSENLKKYYPANDLESISSLQSELLWTTDNQASHSEAITTAGTE